MKTAIGIIAALLLISIVAAEDIGLDNFDAASGATPPPVQTVEEDSQSSPASPAEGTTIRLIDLNSGERITYSHVQYSTGTQESIIFIENDTLHIPIEGQEEDITLKVDRIGTPGNDYYRNIHVIAGSTVDALLLPIGSLQGKIISEGRIVTEASINIECGGNYGEEGEVRSDRYGSYSSYWLPTGHCQVRARSGDRVGYGEVDIIQGEIATLDITLDHQRAATNIPWWIIILALLITGSIITIAVQGRSKRKQVATHETTTESAEAHHTRTEDLMRTLNTKEKQVMSYLVKTEDKNATQGQIKNATLIPKTSLSRILSGLEAKQLIEIEKMGKMKRIKLTEFFLGEKN